MTHPVGPGASETHKRRNKANSDNMFGFRPHVEIYGIT